MEGPLLARARERLQDIRSANEAEETRRRREIYTKYPDLRALEERIRALMPVLYGAALRQGHVDIAALEREGTELREQKTALLVQHGYPADYLERIYACPLCRDRGDVDGRICRCLETLYKLEQTRDLAPLLQQEEQSFASFRLDYYSALSHNGHPSARAYMERILAMCQSYAESFGPGSRNLLFSGNPGLGKTYLSGCIAREVADKGFSVAYDTVSGLLAAFEAEKFGRDEFDTGEASSRVRQLMTCDLLILDDLGTELGTAFTQSALYTLIDGRIRAGKKTIISTNLGADELAARYSPALCSRLLGEFHLLEFRGEDIRKLRKERS